jgi:hypothetical protein
MTNTTSVIPRNVGTIRRNRRRKYALTLVLSDYWDAVPL